jgi:SHS2 domain-containing protein
MKPTTDKYQYLEHTADAKFKAYGKTLEETFENAALATLNIMTDTETINAETQRSISITADSQEWLLQEWLSELLYLFEVDNLLSGTFNVEEITERQGQFHLSGTAIGEYFDPEKHHIDAHIKGITMHELQIEKEQDGYIVQVIVDI